MYLNITHHILTPYPHTMDSTLRHRSRSNDKPKSILRCTHTGVLQLSKPMKPIPEDPARETHELNELNKLDEPNRLDELNKLTN